MNKYFVLISILTLGCHPPEQLASHRLGQEMATIAFYNVENLFDSFDDPLTKDDDYTPMGKLRYTKKDYSQKLVNISKAIAGIGSPQDRDGPELLGLAEIENLDVLKDLCKAAHLEEMQYQIIHEDSEDHRGIDVALLYKDQYFLPISHSYHKVGLWDNTGMPIKTRDVLHVHGVLHGEEIHLIVNHWPSRRGGSEKSSPRREKAAFVNRKILAKIREENENASVVIMGDFNDDPWDKSIKKGLMGLDPISGAPSKIINPMQKMFDKGWNSMVYRDRLHLFDQILFSETLLRSPQNEWKFYKSGIYRPGFLVESEGKYRGYPRRSFSNGKFADGYSDHFPVYLQLSRK